MIRTSLKFDMRAPAFGTPPRELYAAALDMAEFADSIGVAGINAMEHHGFEDGYLPTPFVLGGGFAARTKAARIILGAVILPLHDPLKIAEQIAVLDVMSDGRLDVIFGAGYVAAEFERFGRSTKDRGRSLDTGIDLILRALRGEAEGVDGRAILTRPLPVQAPEDIVLVGGGVEASAKRAARFGLGFSPTRRGLFDLYDAECRALGTAPGRKFGPSGIGDVHLTHDPEAAWAKILPHLRHHVADYARIAEASGAHSPFAGLLTDDEALKGCGIMTVCTPEELVEKAAQVDDYGSITFMPLIGGLDPAVGWESLKLLETVMPALNAMTPQPGRDR